jgi:lactate dehydrogenase-like 2-hydroxyacid dehydrogenase
MLKPKVLVTRRWPEAVEAQMAAQFDVDLNSADKPLTQDDFRDAMARYDAILPTVTDKLPAAVFDTSPRTRILANYGVGFAHIDTAAAKTHGIRVTNTPDVLSECTADIAMTLMLMVARRAGEGERELREGRWTGWRPTHLIGTKVSGATLGIIGFGRIGQAMAQRAHFGFGMKILVQNRSAVPADVLARYNAVQVPSIEDLLPHCDFVSLHCPGGAANRHLINASRLDLMKPTAFLINTARGEVVDEHALAQALLNADNLVLLPHLGSATRETREAMGFRVLENLTAFFDGREPRDLVA